ncbi:phenolic glucoside malonyltransferase 2-like [Impatiens glandulifera]|uniref:phenolic glucoside malonyltransferase 2-like n=1 Tax=Impatiens glandulifera TaxID=253017 RepID=UPI001FB12682|nr:phenolic glucoside malonyltransferase 2-like [Impatiens glandulifera]
MDEPTQSVRVLEICNIPPRDPNSVKDSLPLTFFDLLWLRNPPSRRLFFFHYPCSLHCFSQSVLPRLKQSLSAALNPYPHLAGNVTWDKDEKIPTLHYFPGDAVSVTIAEATTAVDFHRISTKEDLCGVDNLFSLLPPLSVSPERAAVMALQITLFPNNGFSIGYTTNHAVIDGKTTALFMKSWAWFCRSGGDTTSLPADLTPFYDRKNLKNLDEAYLAHYEGESNKTLMKREINSLPDMVIGNFMLTSADLEKIKISLKHLNTRITNFMAAAAYTWTCSVRAQDVGNSKNVNLVIPVDCRNRSESGSIPPTYFGNCIGPLIVSASRKDLTGGNGLETAAKVMIEGFDRKVFGREERWLPELMDACHEIVYAVAGSPRFGLYEVDFGWGRPRNVQLVWNRSRIFHFQDAAGDANDGGIEISMVMGKTEILTFSSLFITCLDALS